MTLLTLAGCGGDSAVTVEGKVLCDGKAVAKGTVRFVPDKGKGNTSGQEPTGQIGADGSYSLSTTTGKGAALGWYKVSVVSQEIPDSSKPNALKSYIALRYADPEKSGLSVEVVRTPASGAYDLKVTEK
jgi:hypothetical protein